MAQGQPADGNGNPIPALCPAPGLAKTITTSGTTAKNSVPFDKNTKVIEVRATADCFYRFGDSTVTATSSDNFLASGETRTYSIAPGSNHYDYMAAIQSVAGGTVYITELQ